jgi:uncharacterized protein YecE (DUF72 family)
MSVLASKKVMAQRDILIGISGYSYPGPPPKGWFGAFYPKKKSKQFDELKYYSQIFNTCEINNTFYRPPSSKVTKGWATKTPDDFTFCRQALAEVYASGEDFPKEIGRAVGASHTEGL